jgi:nicotinate-nucleotide adenylyltransferase
MKIGFFGGTFNPIHFGHLRAAEEIRTRLSFDRVIFIPSGTPPLKNSDLADARHRYRMTGLAISENPFFELSDIELENGRKSYTVDTIEKLKERFPFRSVYFILGIDAFLDIPNWRLPEKLISLIDFVVIPRPPFAFTDLSTSPYLDIDSDNHGKLAKPDTKSYGLKLKSGHEITVLPMPLLDISATRIRKLLKNGESIKYLLPAAVESYIIANKLYIS